MIFEEIENSNLKIIADQILPFLLLDTNVW